MTRTRAFAILREVFDLWDLHSIPRLAAALAFYAVLSLAPFLVLVVGVSAMVFGERMTQQDAVHELRELVGPEATLLIGGLLSSARRAPSNLISGSAAVVLLFFGASSAFVELRSALNYIWEVPEPSAGMIGGFLKDRLFAFCMTSVMALLLLACLGASVVLRVFQPVFATWLVIPGFLVLAGNLLISFGVISLTFSLIFRYVPAKRMDWKHACAAGFVTGAFFSVARVPLDLYLLHAAVGSGYGAAASVVVFLMWIYFAAQIFYLGAEFAWLLASGFARP